MGIDDNDEYVIRGVILDNPTPFTMGEMMESKASGGVYENLIFRGGESGGQEAFCLHSTSTMGLEEIGTSSIYQGGELDKIKDPSKVKFFFNYMEFLEHELEDMLEIIHEDGDGWTSVGKYSTLLCVRYDGLQEFFSLNVVIAQLHYWGHSQNNVSEQSLFTRFHLQKSLRRWC
jgi:hypothetical protein